MPSKLSIRDAHGGETTEMWIEKSFLTIGGGNDCDVCVASCDVAGPAVYVQFRDGGFEAFNKAASTATLAGRHLALGQRAPWLNGDLLAIGGGVELRLEIEGDASPAPRPIETAASRGPDRARPSPDAQRPVTAAVTVAAAGGPGLGTRVGQLLVTLGCVVAAALMLLGGFDAPSSSGIGGENEFDEVIRVFGDAGNPSATPASAKQIRLLQRLRAAEAAFRQKDVSTARERYVRLRRYMDSPSPAGGESTNPPEESLRHFINRRLASIAGSTSP